MSLPTPLGRARTDELARGGGQLAANGPQGGHRPLVVRLRGRARALAGRATRGVARVALGPVTEWVHRGPAELAQVGARLGRVEEGQMDVEVARQGIESNRINGELLKSEVREIERKLDEVGTAFAPTAGISGAGVRFAELREQVNALERRMRRLDAALDAQSRRPAVDASTMSEHVGDDPASARDRQSVEPAGPAFLSERFNYVAFERRFRGDPQDVLRIQTERYSDLLAAHEPVVDIGCGRGELLAELGRRGVRCFGVEPDAGMVAEARGRGVEVEHTDLLTFLRNTERHSVGALFTAHVAEHVPVEVLLEMVELAARAIVPGGIFVAETPNPATLVVLGESFIVDPTHVRPIHPALFAFLCETAGFRDVRLEFYSPADHHRLRQIDVPDGAEWAKALSANITTLNDVLFGPQEYAVIATTPPAIGSPA